MQSSSCMNDIKAILDKYTTLNEAQIAHLEMVAGSMAYISDLTKSDVFIDVRYLNESNTAIVIAEHLRCEHSLYNDSVLEQFAFRDNEPAVLKCIDTGVLCHDIRAISQENKVIIQNVVPIVHEGITIAALIEERIETKFEFSKYKIKVLNKEVDILTNILSNIIGIDCLDECLISEGVIIYNGLKQVVYYNQKANSIYKELGFSDELKSYTYDQLVLSNTKFDDIVSNESFLNYIKIGNYYLTENKYYTPSDDVKCVVILQDLTDMKNKDNEIISSKQAISEIHHRIKNNLQVISSMLRIQSRLSNNQEVSNALNSSVQRIVAISNVHELLSKAISDSVSVQEIVSSLVHEIRQYISIEQKQITIEMDVDDIILDSSRLTILSIIINELVANSLEHAFLNTHKGTIWIRIKLVQEQIEVSIEDNGSGYTSNIKANGLGTKFVEAYVHDSLKGIIKADSTPQGVAVNIKFRK